MIKFKSSKKVLLEIGKALLKLLVVGLLIGYLKEYDGWIAILLFLKVIHVVYFHVLKKPIKNWPLLSGMIFTAVVGLLIELWGVSYGHWEYHKVSTRFPLWLPFAWLLAFRFLYQLEYRLLLQIEKPTVKHKLILTFFICLLFPTIGEMITIYLGVWTYYLPYQLLGVPFYAIITLLAMHTLIYLIISYVCKRIGFKDLVFTEAANS